MSNRKAAAIKFGEKGLDIAQNRLARCRVARMPDCRDPFEPINYCAFGEIVPDKTHAPF